MTSKQLKWWDEQVASLSSKAASAERARHLSAELSQLSEEIEDCEGVQEELRAKPGELVYLAGVSDFGQSSTAVCIPLWCNLASHLP
jgi:C4-dicarboxylate-specific signal transduction histidine kinase